MIVHRCKGNFQREPVTHIIEPFRIVAETPVVEPDIDAFGRTEEPIERPRTFFADRPELCRKTAVAGHEPVDLSAGYPAGSQFRRQSFAMQHNGAHPKTFLF